VKANISFKKPKASNKSKILKQSKASKSTIPDVIQCPKCVKGTVIKGQAAYGCSDYKLGCGFLFPFDEIRKKSNGEKLTKELVYKILNGNT
jgi:DNA topoisomerase-3